MWYRYIFWFLFNIAAYNGIFWNMSTEGYEISKNDHKPLFG